MSANKLYLGIILYLYLPLIVFLLGWVSPVVSVPVLLISIIGIFFAMKNVWNNNKSKIIPVSVLEMGFVLLLFIAFFVFVGQGDLFPQDFDWHKHHAIFNDLLNYSWPVVYDNNSMLTYYLGQYIVPAAIAKILFHSNLVMRIMIPVWNALGLLLVYIFMVSFLKAETKFKKLGILLAIFFWGGATNWGNIVYKIAGHETLGMLDGEYKWIDLEHIRIHFASNYDACYGAFQHVISPWVACSFFVGNRKNAETYVMIALPLMFSATFGFVYFTVLLLFFAIYDIMKDKRFKEGIKTIFSKGNLFLLPMTAVILIYLAGNFLGDKPSAVGLQIIHMADYMDFFIIFVLCEFLGYAIFLFRRNKRNVMFYAIIIELLIIPFISLGLFNDLCSRGGIPARYVLMLLCIEQIYNSAKKDWRYVGLATLLVIAALNTEVQICAHIDRTIADWKEKSYLKDDYKSFEGYAGNPDIRVDEAYNYFTLNYSDSLFKKIARK